MGAKRLLSAYNAIQNGVMTGTTSLSSPVTNIENLDNIGIQFIWTGTPTGTLSILCSIDGVTFDTPAPAPTLSQPAGSAGHYLVNLNQLPFRYIKLRYVNASGVGVLNAWICGKDLN